MTEEPSSREPEAGQLGSPEPAPALGHLLEDAKAGDAAAVQQLLPIIYEALKVSARRQIRAYGRETLLDTTALVHEAWIDLFARCSTASSWESRAHFLRYSARVMRSVLVDHLRAASAEKRGGQRLRVELSEVDLPVDLDLDGMLALDQALNRLAGVSERLVEVVELRYFAGLDVDAVAAVYGVAPRTIVRDWRKARLLLQEMLDERAR